ncbi:pyridoxamine 5'-phosphate oxidase family protein [Roseibium sp. HPY-6]|uniref:pyridoxamine 5'-phosphate oxidase family protein n=1 Tax=Roseibium sp. HPY-6 TaxID=3229852 RepID=UPI00338D9C5F
MQEYRPKPELTIRDEASLRALFPATHELAIKKCQATLDKHARDYIARSPFLCLGTQNADGKADVSPRGDPAGFVKVVDRETLVIPDRPGNNRLDSLVNIVSNPSVGLLFLIPGFDDTLRVNGTASLVVDPDLLETLSINGRAPTIAILVKVTSVFMHCAKAFRRSHLWDPDRFLDRSEMPSLMNIILDQTEGAPQDDTQMNELDQKLEEEYRNTLY